MLKQLEISNYQSHKRTEIELHPGINVIIGSSDVGKTAIIRALTWLIWNRPSGEAFQSSWGGATKVTAETDKMKISRIKSADKNAYVLGVSEFHAIKTDVPVEVLQALNVNTINVQRQFDRPFLLDSSPGVVAQFFNTIAHLDVIDRATSNVQRWVREITQRIQSRRDQIKELEAKLVEYENLDDLDSRVTDLESLDQKRIDAEVELSKVRKIIVEVKYTDERISKYDFALKLDAEVVKVINLITERKIAEDRSQNLEKLLQDLERLYDRVEQAELGAANAQLQFDESFPDVCPLCGNRRK